MLMAARRTAHTVLLRVYGLVFLVVLTLLVGLTIAIYNKAFVASVPVSLQTDRIGNQLQPASDVKLRGLIVGTVRSVETRGDGATVHLALDPAAVPLIPRNVEARLLPKTLFGEKYVDLVVQAQPAPQPIARGDVIPQDRSQVAIELERVLDDVLPVLRAIKPDKLAFMLGALATALDGRGDRIGQNLELVDAYFRQLNPQLPTIQADISGLADFARTYADAAPDLLRVLDNFAFSSRTVVAQQQQMESFFRSTSGFATTATDVLAANGDRLIQLAQVSRPTLQLLARYSPEYPCLLRGLVAWQPRITAAFGGQSGAPGDPKSLHITLEVVQQRQPYVPGEYPAYLERSGPNCRGLDSLFRGQDPPFKPDDTLRDGSRGPNVYADPSPAAPASGFPAVGPAAFADGLSSLSGTRAEAQFVAPILAPVLGVSPNQVPDIAALLFAPMARGTAVRVA